MIVVVDLELLDVLVVDEVQLGALLPEVVLVPLDDGRDHRSRILLRSSGLGHAILRSCDMLVFMLSPTLPVKPRLNAHRVGHPSRRLLASSGRLEVELALIRPHQHSVVLMDDRLQLLLQPCLGTQWLFESILPTIGPNNIYDLDREP